MSDLLKKWRIKKALQSDDSLELRISRVREHSQKAKILLHSHKRRKPKYHSKIAIKKAG